jgi:hypothetical protein
MSIYFVVCAFLDTPIKEKLTPLAYLMVVGRQWVAQNGLFGVLILRSPLCHRFYSAISPHAVENLGKMLTLSVAGGDRM